MDITQNVLTVSHNGEVYEFKIPSQRDKAKLGSVAKFYRAKDDPTGIGSPDGLDISTFYIYEAMATFSVLLKKGPRWCWTESKNGPAFDPDSLPDDSPMEEVYQSYLDALDRFHYGTDESGEPGIQETVASQQNP